MTISFVAIGACNAATSVLYDFFYMHTQTHTLDGGGGWLTGADANAQVPLPCVSVGVGEG